MGVVTWFEAARDLPKEDMLGLAEIAAGGDRAAGITVAVPHLPRLANLDDLDPLAAEPDVRLLVLEPGSRCRPRPTSSSSPAARRPSPTSRPCARAGWDIDILAHVRRGGRVLGLCGGYQMLGRSIADPAGRRGPARRRPGPRPSRCRDRARGGKDACPCAGHDLATGAAVAGYEIHMGRTTGPGRDRPMLRLASGTDGAVSADGRVMGCYLHGLLAADSYRAAFLAGIRARTAPQVAFAARVEAALDGLAAHLERCLDLDRVLTLAAPLSP